ncbi:hypothetical protein [Microbacterium sp. zg.Y1084]|nr:hypothetical protein [Microbacterium sp. zg.Y1084]MCR2814039.1 hypothetical protein [Microbacterium sp. zg.Y1084]
MSAGPVWPPSASFFFFLLIPVGVALLRHPASDTRKDHDFLS